MINRRPFDCDACGVRIVTRTAIGHGFSQVHAFPCPGCGVGIQYELYLDQENVTFDYGPKPANATWVDTEEGAVWWATFDAEALLPRSLPSLTVPQGGPFSPFMAMGQVHRDIREFKQDFGEQVYVIRHRHILDRMLVHIENANWDLLAKELAAAGDARTIGTHTDARAAVRRMVSCTQRPLIKNYTSALNDVTELVSSATEAAQGSTGEFLTIFRESKRLLSLWQQMKKFRRDFLALSHAMIPVLQVKYWKTPAALADCHISNKQFEPLKALYIDAFETLARIAVLAMAFDRLTLSGSTHVPTIKGKMSIWEFEGLANANKAPLLKKSSRCAFLVPFLDTALRNGIGHNAAHYDPASDEVVLYKQAGEKLNEKRLNYTEFVDKVLTHCSMLLEVDWIVFWLLEANSGRLV